jgi:hypothetical protein
MKRNRYNKKTTSRIKRGQTRRAKKYRKSKTIL